MEADTKEGLRMSKVLEERIRAYFLANGGSVVKGRAGASIAGNLPIAGKERYCAVGFSGNPIRTCVSVAPPPEDFERFMGNLQGLEGADDFSVRVILEEDYVLWTMDLILTSSPIEELLGLWHALASLEIEKLEAMMGAPAENGFGTIFRHPLLSGARH